MKYLTDMENEIYHGDRTAYSSSQLKTILDDPEKFYQKYIAPEKINQLPRTKALIVGDAFHTKILEPHLYDKNFAVWEGPQKRGKAYDQFVEHNQGKIILGNMENAEIERLVNNVMDNEYCLPYITGGQAEVSIFGELMGVPVKIRADYINEDQSYIQDLKSTKELPNSTTIQRVVKAYGYDLSAALYMDLANKYFRKAGKAEIKEFIWIFSSKNYDKSQIFRASKAMLEVGRKKYQEALALIKEYDAKQWEFSQPVIELDPIEKDQTEELF